MSGAEGAVVAGASEGATEGAGVVERGVADDWPQDARTTKARMGAAMRRLFTPINVPSRSCRARNLFWSPGGPGEVLLWYLAEVCAAKSLAQHGCGFLRGPARRF